MTDEIQKKRAQVVLKLIHAWRMFKEVEEILSECNSISPNYQTALVKFIIDIEPRILDHLELISVADGIMVTIPTQDTNGKWVKVPNIEIVKEYLKPILEDSDN
jgi:hypothetical protein